MCEMHSVWSYPTWPSRWGKRISKDWPRLKSCQAVCDECTRGEICSGQSLDAGCFLRSWGGRVSLKFGVHDVIVLFLFATMGFHIARLGFFGPQQSCYKGSLLYLTWLLCSILWMINQKLPPYGWYYLLCCLFTEPTKRNNFLVCR